MTKGSQGHELAGYLLMGYKTEKKLLVRDRVTGAEEDYKGHLVAKVRGEGGSRESTHSMAMGKHSNDTRSEGWIILV